MPCHKVCARDKCEVHVVVATSRRIADIMGMNAARRLMSYALDRLGAGCLLELMVGAGPGQNNTGLGDDEPRSEGLPGEKTAPYVPAEKRLRLYDLRVVLWIHREDVRSGERCALIYLQRRYANRRTRWR